MSLQAFSTNTGGGGGTSTPYVYDPTTSVIVFDDFTHAAYLGSGQLNSEHAWTTIQTGSPMFTGIGSTIPSDQTHPGVLEVTVTTSGDGGAICPGVFGTSNTPSWAVGNGLLTFESLVKIQTLSDGTNDGSVDAGFCDSPSWAAPGNCIKIIYQRATQSTWYLVTKTGGVQTQVNSAITPTSGWHHLKIVIAANGTSVEFFIDGVSGGTSSTNIPTAVMPHMVSFRKTAGAGALQYGIDYVNITKTLTVAR